MKDPVDPSNLKMAIPLVKSLLIITDGPVETSVLPTGVIPFVNFRF